MVSKSSELTARLVENQEEETHATVLEENLARATRFICIVAFAKWSGWKLISKLLAARFDEGLEATFVIGIDFYQSDPDVLRTLLKLRRAAKSAGGELKVYMGSEAGCYTLHPKVYWTKDSSGETLIVGSANMTSGGFDSNHELSVELAGASGWRGKLDRWIKDRLASGDIVEADANLIDEYERRRIVYRTAVATAERRARRSLLAPAGQVIVLTDLLAEMRAAEGEEGFEAKVKRRRQDHRRARSSLREFTALPRLSRSQFLDAYENLIRYWHSGGLVRNKTGVAKKGSRVQDALRAFDAARSNDPAVLFDLLKSHFDRIPRAGTNVLTELLHTRDPKRYPVMNRNSVAGLRLANITGYPALPTKAAVDGAMYARFAADALKLQQSLGLRDLAELDVLFNYAYWKPEGEPEEQLEED